MNTRKKKEGMRVLVGNVAKGKVGWELLLLSSLICFVVHVKFSTLYK